MPLAIERKIIESARTSDEALESLIRSVWPEAYRMAFAILRDPGLAEDAAQEGCAAIARSLSQLKDAGAFSAWSYKIIVNQALSALRRRPSMLPLDVQIANRAIDFEPAEALDLYRALATLSPVQRATVLLHYYAGLRSREIASAIGVPASTVRFHLMLARRRLREALSDGEERCPDPTDEVLSNVH